MDHNHCNFWLKVKFIIIFLLKLILHPSAQLQTLPESDLLSRRWERGGLEEPPEEEAAWMPGGSHEPISTLAILVNLVNHRSMLLMCDCHFC